MGENFTDGWQIGQRGQYSVFNVWGSLYYFNIKVFDCNVACVISRKYNQIKSCLFQTAKPISKQEKRRK